MNFDEWREIYFAGPLMNEAMARAAWDAAIAAEREACAKLCEEQAIRSEASMRKSKTVKAREIYSSAGQTAHWMAAAIRAMG